MEKHGRQRRRERAHFFFPSLFISSRQMPSLTRRGKRLLLKDLEDDEDDLGNIDTVGILAQRAARREAAWEQEAAQAQEPAGNQVPVHNSDSFLLYAYMMHSLNFRMTTGDHQHLLFHFQSGLYKRPIEAWCDVQNHMQSHWIDFESVCKHYNKFLPFIGL
jgi:hypothetical protein